MTEFFLTVVNMSVSATWIVLAVMIFRMVLKKAPKWITVLLWGIVGVRLVFPFSIESAMSLIPSVQTINPEIAVNTPEINSGVPIIDNAINPVIGEATVTLQPEKSINLFQFIMPYLTVAWLVGITALLIYTAVSYFRLKKKIGTAVLVRENIYQSESVVSPFVLGLIKPKIYLPFNICEQDMLQVIAHEKAHIRRKDHLWKPIGFLLLTVHWFNPFMWVGYAFLCRDIELACDEKVVKNYTDEQKADYSQALLNCSVNRRMITACPLAFGEVGVKNRVKSVLNYKKPAFWIIVISIITSISVAVCFLTNPPTQNWESDNYTINCNVISAECDDIEYEFKYGTLSEDYPYICVNWTNNRDDLLCFGNEFTLYKGNEIVEPKEEIASDTILNIVETGKSKSENYNLSFYELEKNQTYRLEKQFYLKSTPEQKYTAFISFSVETMYSFVGKQYMGEKIVYKNGNFSSLLYTDINIPQFIISEKQLNLYKTEETLNYEFKKVDGLQKIKLEKSNFDDLFTNEIWNDGLTAKKIRKNNLNAFSAYDLYGKVYYLLEQKNGEIYIAQSNGVTSDFRWLFKMKEVDKSVSVNLDEQIYWQYYPMASFIGNNFFYFDFDFDYTKIKATCNNGKMWSPDTEGQPLNKSMEYEKGKSVCWTPNEAVIEKISEKSQITITVFNNEELIHSCKVVFDCTKRDSGYAEFKVYLEKSNGLKLVDNGNGGVFYKSDSVSSVGGVDGPDDITTQSFKDPKKSIYNKMLNTIDYFNKIELKLDTNMLVDTPCELYCHTDIDGGVGYETIIQNGKNISEDYCEGERIIEIDNVKKIRREEYFPDYTRADSPYIPLEKRTYIEDDGYPAYRYRQNISRLPLSSFSVVPQEITFSYLADFDKWKITDNSIEYLGRKCIEIKGIPTDYSAEKQNCDAFSMLVDSDTGILMKFSATKNGKITNYSTVKEIEFDSENPVQTYEKDKYSDYQLSNRRGVK